MARQGVASERMRCLEGEMDVPVSVEDAAAVRVESRTPRVQRKRTGLGSIYSISCYVRQSYCVYPLYSSP
jgi:hypothetical protein